MGRPSIHWLSPHVIKAMHGGKRYIPVIGRPLRRNFRTRREAEAYRAKVFRKLCRY